MSEPTDHRAQAERAMRIAADLQEVGKTNPYASVTAALLGIGHALLAGIDVLAEDEPHRVMDYGTVTVPADAGTPGLDAHIAELLAEQLGETDGRCTYTENSGGVQLRCDLTTGHKHWGAAITSGHRLRLNP